MLKYIIIAFIVLIVLELIFPKRKFAKKVKLNSYMTNAVISIFNNLLVYFLSLTSIYYVSQNYFSLNLLSNLDYTNYLVFFSILILLDFMIYIWHFLNHKISILWMFHKAHHTEVYLNTSSGFRFHIGELLLSIIFKSFVLIVILGIPVNIILISESIIVIFSMFHHTNIKFKGEKLLSKIIIVPYLHQVHHSTKRKECDNNYGVIFSFWDRIFRTFLDIEIKKIGLMNIKFQNFLKFMEFGLRNSKK